MRRVIAGFACSIDGFIKGPKGEIDWIISDKEQFKELEQQWADTDAMFHGRVTYEEVIKQLQASKGKKQANPFAHMKHYVFSKTLKTVEDGFILVKGNTEEEVKRLKSEVGKNIAVFGGANLLAFLLNHDLVDELVLAICPVLLGGGKRFFPGLEKKINFQLKEAKSYSSGLVMVTYVKVSRE